MKITASNTRVAFAYQETEASAAVLNFNLNKGGARPIIRVVQPGSLTDVTGVSRNPEYSGDHDAPVQSLVVDKLVSAAATDIYYYNTSGSGFGTFSGITTEVHHVQIANDGQNINIIDIVISEAFFTEIEENGKLARATILLTFESGADEVMELYLRDSRDLILNIDPRTLSLSSVSSHSVHVPDLSGGNTYTVYSTAKAYRQATDRTICGWLRLGGAHRDHGAGGLFYTYGQPWGFTTTSGPVIAEYGSNAINNSQFGTSTPSKLKWFTGKSDLSWSHLHLNGFFPSNTQTNQTEFIGESGGFEVDLKNLFKLTPLIGSLSGNSSNNGSVPSYLVNVSPQFNGNNTQNSLGWGQTYGWYCDSPDSDLYVIGQTNPLYSRQNGNMIFGAPFSIGGNGTTAYDINTTYADERPGFDGNFTSVDNNPVVNPQSLSFAKLGNYVFDNLPLTEASTLHAGGGTSYRGFSASSPTFLGRAIDPTTTTYSIANPYFCTASTLDKYLNGAYIWNFTFLTSIAIYTDNAFATLDLLMSNIGGSVRDLITASTNAANFFYAGTAGTATTFYESVFKGIVRVMYLNDTSGGSITQLSHALASESDNSSLEGVDRLGVLRNADAMLSGESVFGPGSGDSNTIYNPVDLTASALYSSMHINGKSNAPLSRPPADLQDQDVFTIGYNSLAGRSAGTLGDYDFVLIAQDIAYINVGVNVLEMEESVNPTISSLCNAVQPVFNHKPSVTDGHLSMNSLLNAPVAHTDVDGNDGLQVGAAPSWQMIGWGDYSHPPFPIPMNQGAQDIKGFGGITSSNLGDAEDLFGAGFSTGGSGTDYDFSPQSGKYPFPRNYNKNDFIVSSGTSDCFKIMASSVAFSRSTGAASPLTDDGNKKVTLKVFFTNSCSGTQFKADDGTIITTAGMDKAARITHVLQIFPHIEYNPLAAQVDFFTDQDPAGLAYKTIVADADDVDDIRIDSDGNGFILTVVISQDASDVFDNPNDAFPIAVTSPGVDLWLDTTIPASVQETVQRPFPDLYGHFLGRPEYSFNKGSFFTISHTADWKDFAVTAGDEYTGENLVYHHQFLTYGVTNQEDVADDVESVNLAGCTDNTADNFNPDAVTDDGSCTFCNDFADGSKFDWNFSTEGIGGMKAGVYQSETASVPPAAGVLSEGLPSIQQATGSNNTPNSFASIYHTPAGEVGGAVSAQEDTFNVAATGLSLNIRTNTDFIDGALTQILEHIASEYDQDESAWKLEIKPLNEDALDDAINESINALGLNSYNSNNELPVSIASITPIYSSTANAGTFMDPRWTDIATPDSPLANLKTGVPYFLVLSLEPTATMPAACTEFLADKAKTVSIMWVTFCGCATVGNDYLNNAMSFTPYEWQNNIAWPVVPYQGGASSPSCPDSNSAQPFGDNAYGTGQNNSLCFQSDELADDCDDFFLYCIASTNTICETLANLENVQSEAYQDENGFFYLPYAEISVTVNIEGVYNTNADTYILPTDPPLSYTLTVFDSDNNVVATQTQADQSFVGGPQGNIYQHVFENIPGPGTYTVQWVFNDAIGSATYPDNIGLVQEGTENGWPCTYTDTFTIQTPDLAGCPEIILGCTDPAATNFNSLANVDDGSCQEPVDPCPGVWVNPDLSVVSTVTNSTSTCSLETITVGNVEYQANVITPDNNGTIVTATTYTPPGDDADLAIDSFAVLVYPTNIAITGLGGVIDANSVLFDAYNTNTELGSTIAGGLGFYSNLFVITSQATSQTFNFTFNNLPPQDYFVIAVPNFGAETLEACAGNPFITLEDEINTVQVLQDAPGVPCEEPCFGINCGDWTLGCTDPNATNYNDAATLDDGSCEFDVAFCENPANESHPLCAGCDAADAQSIGFRSAKGRSDEEICDPFTGATGECTDPLACNYNPDAVASQSNNNICDYCSCAEIDDPACYDDSDCDPDSGADCEGFEPICPDPSNPLCDPTIYDPCPNGECGPPLPPCLILGNCDEGEGDGGPQEGGVFIDEVPTIELTCMPQVDVSDPTSENATYDSILQNAFLCMSEEGKKLMFKMKAGADYEDVDLLKLSLVSYLLNGGSDFADLPCLFNCNYDSAQKNEVVDVKEEWANGGGRFWNSTDTFQRNMVVLYFYPVNGVMTRNYYRATRTITPLDLAPRYEQSGWHRIRNVKVRTADTNGIATGEERYLQTFVEFMTRHCQSCQVKPRPASEEENLVDPTLLPNSLDPKTTTKTIRKNPSGILGEDGDEIIF